MLLLVFGLIELDDEIARDFEVCDQAIAVVLNILGELDSPRLKLTHCLHNVIAVERDVSSTGRGFLAIGWMHTEVSFGRIEDEPALTYIMSIQAKLVSEERTELVSS